MRNATVRVRIKIQMKKVEMFWWKRIVARAIMMIKLWIKMMREVQEEEEEQKYVDLNEKESQDQCGSETCDPSVSTPSRPRFTHVCSSSQQLLCIPK